jgi:chromosome segregation ATPase
LAAQEQKVRSCREEYETVKVKGGKTDLKAAILKREWNRYESGLKGLDAKERKLEVRKARFAAASEQLDAMTTMRVQLETKLEELEARLADLRLREAGDPVAFDDGQLGDIKEGISNLSDRISKMENLRDLEARYNDKVDGSSSTKKVADDDDLLRQIDDHFKPSKNGQKVAADRE